jgi:hypothetical protein
MNESEQEPLRNSRKTEPGAKHSPTGMEVRAAPFALSRDLRALADADRSEAPSDLRARLLIEFRRRSARKRRMAWLPAVGIGAIAAALLVFVWMPKQSTAVPNPLDQPVLQTAEDTDADFYPLPDAEGLPPIENATVVRVQMPLTSLELMGVAVNDVGAADPVQADILLGQDGLARGVRLVQ